MELFTNTQFACICHRIRERAHITSSRVGGPDTNDDFEDALRGGWGGNHQNDDVIY